MFCTETLERHRLAEDSVIPAAESEVGTASHYFELSKHIAFSISEHYRAVV